MDPILLARKQVGQLLGVSTRTVNTLIANRELPVIRIGRRTLVNRKRLEKFAQQSHTTRKPRTDRARSIETAGVPSIGA